MSITLVAVAGVRAMKRGTHPIMQVCLALGLRARAMYGGS